MTGERGGPVHGGGPSGGGGARPPVGGGGGGGARGEEGGIGEEGLNIRRGTNGEIASGREFHLQESGRVAWPKFS